MVLPETPGALGRLPAREPIGHHRARALEVVKFEEWASEHRAIVDVLRTGTFRNGFLKKMQNLVRKERILSERQLEVAEDIITKSAMGEASTLTAPEEEVTTSRDPLAVVRELAQNYRDGLVTAGTAMDAIASAVLDPSKPKGLSTEGVTVGVYRHDGDIYVVKPNRAKTRSYASKIVRSPGRLTVAGKVVEYELQYAPGMMAKLSPEERLPLAEVERILIKYGRCLVCGHGLKAAASVARMIGPVCIKAIGYALP